jgi:flagellin
MSFTLNNTAMFNTLTNLTKLSAALAISNQRDGAMAQIASLLGTIQTKALAAAGDTATAEEKAAYQAEIDAAVASIDSIVNSTTFNGKALLNGSMGYSLSGVDASKIANVRVNSADTSSGDVDMDISVVSAAEKGSISFSNTITDTVTFTITGPNGSEEFTFGAGTLLETEVMPAINAVTDDTGIEASYWSGTLTFKTKYYGSDETVSIDVTQGTFVMDGGTTSDDGVDATVTVNGLTTITEGLNVNFSSGNNSIKFSLKESFGTVGGGAETFTITGGGSNFALDASPSSKIHIGLSPIYSFNLGTDELGYLSSLKSGGTNAISSGNYQQAANIAAAASQQISTERARFGAMKTYTVEPALSAYAATKTALSSARSNIMDIDYAEETATNNRLQILMQAATYVLANLNHNATSILSLLSG